MSTFVRTNHTTLSLLQFSKMVAVLLLIFFPAIALANPVYQSSSSHSSTPSTVGAQSMQYQLESYKMANTSTYQVGTTYNPASTVYAPFSNEGPGNSGQSDNGPSRISNRKNGFVDSGEHGKEESPIGDAWSLLIFAALAAGVIYIKQRKKIEARG